MSNIIDMSSDFSMSEIIDIDVSEGGTSERLPYYTGEYNERRQLVKKY